MEWNLWNGEQNVMGYPPSPPTGGYGGQSKFLFGSKK